ncbi:hypothetical protein AB1Y20_007558 [Prymnesium parvum]|uniref:RING-type E3 ubiquitin transferase n=1 Tax=Prymnesium parvum TaxID=97485 RepID=A0AB34IXB6_PRYPA
MDEELSPLQARLMATYMDALADSKPTAPRPTAAAKPPANSPPRAAAKPSASRSDLYSKKMGELLLKGWRMQAENCPVTGEVPLMQDPVSGRSFSIALGKFVDELGAAEKETTPPLGPPPPAAAPAVAEAPAEAPAAAAPPPKRSQYLPTLSPEQEAAHAKSKAESDKWSEQLSQLMLKGWKMLGENCPVTAQVPLMQHPTNGRKFSVAIGKFVDELGVPPPSPSSAATPPAPNQLPPPMAPSPQPSPAFHPREASPVLPPPSPPVQLGVAPPLQLGVAASLPPSRAGRTALDAALDAVQQQLLQCSVLLSEAASPPPLPLLDAVTRCAQALSALEAARRAGTTP